MPDAGGVRGVLGGGAAPAMADGAAYGSVEPRGADACVGAGISAGSPGKAGRGGTEDTGEAAPLAAPTSRSWASRAVGRCADSLARHARTSSRIGLGRSPTSGSPVRIRCMTVAISSLPNAGRPVAANVMVVPQANMSAAGPTWSPVKCSGAM